jgi:hypothetical protein
VPCGECCGRGERQDRYLIRIPRQPFVRACSVHRSLLCASADTTLRRKSRSLQRCQFRSFRASIHIVRRDARLPLAHDGWNGYIKLRTHDWRFGWIVVGVVENWSLKVLRSRKDNFEDIGKSVCSLKILRGRIVGALRPCV